MLMTSSETSDEDKDTLHIILSSAKNMKLMNQSLLDTQAIAQKSLKLKYATMNPKKMIDELLSSQQEFLRSFGIKVNTSFKNLPELIQADELRVKEMIFHILNNAIKFNKERKGEIDIFVEGLEEKAKLGGKLV